jgi:hypothetical protein
MSLQEANKMNTENIQDDLNDFVIIWRCYYQLLPINIYEFDIYLKIINKIRNNDLDLTQDKFSFMELLEIMSLTLYNYKENDNDEDVYDDEKEYSDKELNCCYKIKKFLKEK